ncbi:MAG: MFS transporter [Verrucomicrobia bacterium]|nr:MFS transporter [Verrucomicrobiota bacterium]
MKKPSLLVIFLTVFIDLIGFGIVLPLLPLYSQKYGAGALMIGAVMASFSLMQFLFAPWWGGLSDRIGRKPVLLVSTAGSAVSYAVFALASRFEPSMALWVVLFSRVIAGICGANITVAQACIADVSPLQERTKKMGLIGMAFGLGFIFGPALGGKSLIWFGEAGPGWVAAGLCAANLILALAVLPETRKPGGVPAARRPGWSAWPRVLARSKVGLLVGVFFLATLGFSCFETSLGLLVAANFGLDPARARDAETVAILFTFCGIVGALAQGGPVGKLAKKWGEPKMIGISLLLFAAGMGSIPFVRGAGNFSWSGLFQTGGGPWLMLLLSLALLSIGSGLTRPPIFGMISKLTPVDEQGETLGVAQSAGSLARIAGPILAMALFKFHPPAPYVLAAILAVIAGGVAWVKLSEPSRSGES